MKFQYKFALISMSAALALSALISVGNFEIFAIALGLILLFVATIFFIVGLVLYGTSKRSDMTDAFFLTSGIFFLVGIGTCSSLFITS